KAAKQAEKEAKAAAKAAKAAQEKAAEESRKIAEQVANEREKNKDILPPADTKVVLPANATTKEAKLLELLNLYRQDKISPREYQERRSKILKDE
ncbi:MAG: hypothetical protein J5553_04935, partial [Verrucomicrobia bacterium]|nr:hypothetical protein [Verrucomicrobiota bacterium]